MRRARDGRQVEDFGIHDFPFQGVDEPAESSAQFKGKNVGFRFADRGSDASPALDETLPGQDFQGFPNGYGADLEFFFQLLRGGENIPVTVFVRQDSSSYGSSDLYIVGDIHAGPFPGHISSGSKVNSSNSLSVIIK